LSSDLVSAFRQRGKRALLMAIHRPNLTLDLHMFWRGYGHEHEDDSVF
jgi:hypothetical protein